MYSITIKDFLLTPFYLVIIYAFAYLFYRSIRNRQLRSYFFPALTAKIIGALALGLIYKYYYQGGDTFNFYADTLPIWGAFNDSPYLAFKIIFGEVGNHSPDIYKYTQYIYFYKAGDSSTFNVIRLAGFFSLFSFHTYSVMALGFAVVSFTGIWAMYKAFYDMYPDLHWPLAVAVLFVPSVFFWGSGLMKDTITMGALGWLFYAVHFGLIRRKKIILNIFIFVISLWIIKSIKLYILIAFLPSMFLWLALQFRSQIKSRPLRVVSLPFFLLLAVPFSFFAVTQVTLDNKRYQLENISRTSQVTADWLKTVSDQQGGSGYTLGENDGTITGMIAKFPRAVWLGLFQPHPWQAGANPVMLLSALECTFFLYLTFRVLLSTSPWSIYRSFFRDPVIVLCLSFSIILAGAVALSSYNYGTLVRYRIPFIPFYLALFYIIRYRTRQNVKAF